MGTEKSTVSVLQKSVHSWVIFVSVILAWLTPPLAIIFVFFDRCGRDVRLLLLPRESSEAHVPECTRPWIRPRCEGFVENWVLLRKGFVLSGSFFFPLEIGYP